MKINLVKEERFLFSFWKFKSKFLGASKNCKGGDASDPQDQPIDYFSSVLKNNLKMYELTFRPFNSNIEEHR
jgi:hypothetical protein